MLWYSALQRGRVPGNGVTREADRGSNRAACPELGTGEDACAPQAMTVQHLLVSPARPDLPVVIPPPYAGRVEKTVPRRVGHFGRASWNPKRRRYCSVPEFGCHFRALKRKNVVRCPNSAATFGHRSAAQKTTFCPVAISVRRTDC